MNVFCFFHHFSILHFKLAGFGLDHLCLDCGRFRTTCNILSDRFLWCVVFPKMSLVLRFRLMRCEFPKTEGLSVDRACLVQYRRIPINQDPSSGGEQTLVGLSWGLNQSFFRYPMPARWSVACTLYTTRNVASSHDYHYSASTTQTFLYSGFPLSPISGKQKHHLGPYLIIGTPSHSYHWGLLSVRLQR